MKVVASHGIPNTISKFSVPLGCLINMDGTAIYFPLCVVFMAVTQGIHLTPADYVIVCLLSTLASIGTTPIPSSSLVLTVMIAGSVNVPVTGMYVCATHLFSSFSFRLLTASTGCYCRHRLVP
jgi:Na+/H+-dicarboxylate symporter